MQIHRTRLCNGRISHDSQNLSSHHHEKNEWFRIRQESDKITMTYKCIHNDSIDGVEEHDFDAAAQILEKTGLKNTSTQENYREIWKNDEIEICIDTWPGLAPYIEIE